MSYYGRQPTGYPQQRGVDDYTKSLVLHKLTDGLILAVIMSAIVVIDVRVEGGFAGLLLILGVIGYIISIIGYFFARKEETINTLYFIFTASSGVMLGATFSVLLTALENGAEIILGAFGGTTLIVGYLWYKVDSEHPDPNVVGRNLTKYSLMFIALLIISWVFVVSAFVYLLISILGAALFSWYLYYDLSRLQSGQYGSPARMAWSSTLR